MLMLWQSMNSGQVCGGKVGNGQRLCNCGNSQLGRGVLTGRGVWKEDDKFL